MAAGGKVAPLERLLALDYDKWPGSSHSKQLYLFSADYNLAPIRRDGRRPITPID